MRMQRPVAETAPGQPLQPEGRSTKKKKRHSQRACHHHNTFSEAEALRWPAIREALSDETRQHVGRGWPCASCAFAAASDTPQKWPRSWKKP